MNRLLITIALLAGMLISCDSRHPGFKKIDEELYFRLHKFGEEPGTFCEAYFSQISVKTGTLYPNIQNYHSDYGFQNVQGEYLGHGALGKKICGLHKGDSASFIFPYATFKESLLDEYSSDSILVNDTLTIWLSIIVESILDEDQFVAHNNALVREGMIEENEFLTGYIDQKGMTDSCRLIEDVYFMQHNKTDGLPVKYGCEVGVRYTGRFLDMAVFDTSAVTTPFYFPYGKPGQVVRGLEIAVSRLKVGEKATVFVPSHKAFGQQGNTSGIVPPYTPVIFEVELIDVLCAEPEEEDS